MRGVSVKVTRSVSQAGRIRVVNVHTSVNGSTASAAKAVIKKR